MRINNYNKDTNIVANDKWIGSDFNSGGETKNFTPTNLAAYYNHNQVIDSPYLKFTYQTLLPGEVRGEGTISFVSEIGDSVPFSSISTFLVSNKSLKGNTISQYLNFLNGGKVILSRGENINDFGFYKISNVQSYIPDPNFFTITLQFISGNGSMVEDKDYILSLLVDSQTVNNIVTNTSDLVNDGADGIHPFITLEDLPPPASTLQDVTNNGNTTTNDIILNNTVGKYGDYTVVNTIEDLGSFQTFSSPTSEGYNSYYAGYGFGISGSINTYSNYIRGEESVFTVHSQDTSDNSFNGTILLSGTDGVSSSYLSIGNNLGYSSILKSSNITDDLTFQFPNKVHGDYILATIDDIPSLSGFVPYTGATTDVNLGIYNISASKYNFLDTAFSVYGSIELNGEEFLFKTTPTDTVARITYGSTQLSAIGYSLELSYTGLTANRVYTMPNASGTIALTSNLSGYVPYTGATGAVNLGAYDLTVNGLTIGKGAGTGNAQNTAIGNLALSSSTTGSSNTAIGYSALKSSTTAQSNVAVGREALLNVITGEGNIGIGTAPGYAITTGSRNNFIGLVSGASTTTGYGNNFLGDFTGRFNTTGSYNVAIGSTAGIYFNTGDGNVAIGQSAGYNNTSGSRSVFIGQSSGGLTSTNAYATNINNSILIGYNTKPFSTPSTNQIVIGDTAVGIGDNTVTLGNTSITTTRLRGEVRGGSFVKDGGTSVQYLMADGSVSTGPSLSGYVPTSRTLTINGTAYDLTSDRSWSVGTVTSVGLSMPSAFTVSSSPVTTSGTIAVTGAGVASQYIRGDGTLANLPTSTGGGASISYYLNGSVSQGTIGGVAYNEINGVPIEGTGTDFTINADGYIAQFITDAGDPNKLLIPAGNWNFETYFSASSTGGSPRFYIELYKYNGTTFTLIATNSATPEYITGGTSIDLYFTALAVPATTLTVTDRLAVRFYVIHSGRTITMHTEDAHLSQIITTFSSGLTALNGLTSQVQYFAVGTSGTDFNISSATDTHTFNLPTASATNRGALSSTDWTTFNSKQNTITLTTTGSSGSSTFVSNTLNVPTYTLSGLGGQPLATNLTSLSGLSYASTSFVKMTAAGTFALDTNTYLTSVGTGVANQLTYWSGTNTLGSLSTTTYPSLTELSYVKGVTSAIQTQINSKFTLPSFTSGSVLFSNGTTIAQDNTNFFWDDANNKLGIGTNTPYASLTIQDSTSSQIVLKSSIGIDGISSFNGGDLVNFDATSGPYTYKYSALTMIPALGFITFAGFEVLTGNITTGYIPKKSPIGVTNSNIYDDGTNVGINTISPSATLHVNGSMYLQNAATGVESITFSSGPLISNDGPSGIFKSGQVYTNNINGRVGVGTTSPATALDVNGVITATGGNSTSWNAKQNAITLTTTGTSGPATLVGATLNIPQYSGGGGGSTPVKLTSQTLAVGSWTLSGGYYTYSFSNANVTTTCDVSVTPQNASYLTAYNAQVLPFVGVAAGVATFYAQFPPQANMTVDIVITQTT